MTISIQISFAYAYRASNKFSDTLNELFVVNWLISHFFCNNTKWKVVSFPHYLKILLKSTKHGLSYSHIHDWKSISKITFVSGFVLGFLIQISNIYSQKSKTDVYSSNQHYFRLNKVRWLDHIYILPRWCRFELKNAAFVKNSLNSVSLGLTQNHQQMGF